MNWLRSRIPAWYPPLTLFVVVLWIIFSLVHAFGGSGVNVSGADVSFDRQHDVQLFRIDDQIAFQVDNDGDVSVSKYKVAPFPFNVLAGWNERDGRAMSGNVMRMGDWVYSDSPGLGFDIPDAINLKTGEMLTVPDDQAQQYKKTYDIRILSTLPFYTRHGFVVDESHRMTAEQVAGEFQAISTLNESAMIVQAAFLFSVGLLTCVAFIGMLIPRRAVKPEAEAEARTEGEAGA